MMHSETGYGGHTATPTPDSAWSDLGPTPSSISTAPRLNPRILQIVTELGLRYRPLATADQEAHAATVSLLARDLANVDPAKLAAAAEQWARAEKYMPKACDLIALMARSKTSHDQQEICDRANARMASDPDGRRDIRWVVSHGRATLEFVR
jgi:hypothetical protein